MVSGATNLVTRVTNVKGPMSVSAETTHLVIGPVGGFGWEIGDRMVEHGANY